jgi:hypothetical protein
VTTIRRGNRLASEISPRAMAGLVPATHDFTSKPVPSSHHRQNATA